MDAAFFGNTARKKPAAETTTGLPLWAEPGEPDEQRQIDRLVPIARELAAKAGAQGITVSDVRIVAEARGLLTGEERGRRLSYLGKVMEAAGLAKTGDFRRSDIPRSHGNLHAVWRLAAGGAG